MYDTNYNGKNVKRHSYVLPNGYVPTIKYNNAVPTYIDINNTPVPNVAEYINPNSVNHNVVHHMKPSGLSRGGPNYLSGSVYSETAYTNNNGSGKGLGNSPLLNNGTSSSVGCGKSLNCLSNFPCLKKTTKPTESMITNINHDSNNNQRYMLKPSAACSHREPTICNGKAHPVLRSCENLYNIPTKGMQNYEPETALSPVVYKSKNNTNNNNINNNNNNNSNNSSNNKNYILRPASIDKIPNMLHSKEQEIKYTYPPYNINPPTTAEVQRVKRDKTGNDITQRNYGHTSPYDNVAAGYNAMLQMHDKQIKDFNENVKQNIALNNNFDNNMENQKLKEKLLDQKKKYAETLKHIEKLEVEKRTLKKNLIVRDKVLNKLENDMGSIDYENDFLRKIKDKTDLKEIHNVFKYLHGDKKDLLKKKIPKTSRTKYHQDDEAFSNSFNGGDDDDDNDTDDESSNGIVCVNSIKKDRIKMKGKKDFSYKNDVFALKSAIVELEKEVRDLKEENKNVHFKYENTFKTLSELRKDALEYMESIVSRDTRIAYMETSLQKCEKDLSKMKEHSTKQKNMYESKIEKCVSEIKVLEKQSTHLQEMIQEKDTQIVLLKSEIVRNETLIKQYEDRNKELQSELRIMCNNLESVIEASNKKDIYMNELEKELRENEVHRQNAYLKEVAKNRKAQTDIKFKEMLYEKSAKNKINEMHKLKQELYINNIHMQKAKDAYNVLKRTPKLECLMPSAASIDCDCNTDVIQIHHNEKTTNIKETNNPGVIKDKVKPSEGKTGKGVSESKGQTK